MSDPAAFDAFYVTTRGRLLGQLTLLVGDRDHAQDVLQEAYVGPGNGGRTSAGSRTPRGGADRRLEVLHVTDVRTGRTTSYAVPELASGRPFRTAVVSPDETQVALAWTPDSADLVLADRTAAIARLLVWDGTGPPRQAVSARGTRPG